MLYECKRRFRNIWAWRNLSFSTSSSSVRNHRSFSSLFHWSCPYFLPSLSAFLDWYCTKLFNSFLLGSHISSISMIFGLTLALNIPVLSDFNPLNLSLMLLISAAVNILLIIDTLLYKPNQLHKKMIVILFNIIDLEISFSECFLCHFLFSFLSCFSLVFSSNKERLFLI